MRPMKKKRHSYEIFLFFLFSHHRASTSSEQGHSRPLGAAVVVERRYAVVAAASAAFLARNRVWLAAVFAPASSPDTFRSSFGGSL